MTKLNKEIPHRVLSPALSSQDNQGYIRLVSPVPQPCRQPVKEPQVIAAPVAKKTEAPPQQSSARKDEVYVILGLLLGLVR